MIQSHGYKVNKHYKPSRQTVAHCGTLHVGNQGKIYTIAKIAQ